MSSSPSVRRTAALSDRSRRPTQKAADRPDIPVAVHVGDGGDASGGIWGNATSVMGAALPTQLADPIERLRVTHASTESAKAMQRAPRRRPHPRPGRYRSARTPRRRRPGVQPAESGRPSPPDFQPDRLQRRGPPTPAVHRRSTSRGQLPDRSVDRRRRAEHHRDELPRPHRLRLCRLPRDRRGPLAARRRNVCRLH